MLNGLDIKAVFKEPNKSDVTYTYHFSAMALLAYMQQAWPGVETAPGTGTKLSPYMPKSPKEWFYCAKEKTGGRFPNLTDGKAWFKVGGRYIAIEPDSLYASDYGTTGTDIQLDAPTYPNLASGLSTWTSGRVSRTDAKLTDGMRKVAEGKATLDMPDNLPVLTVVLLISEVARNHTAFHTNLMAMDLIQKGVNLPAGTSTTKWTWQNAIWRVDTCPGCGGNKRISCGPCGGHGSIQCNTCRGSGRGRGYSCNSCQGYGNFQCNRCRGSGRTGRYTCNGCNGSGIYRVCNRCDRGTWYEDCRGCNGYGGLRCRTCNGNRDSRCGQCNGSGKNPFSEFSPVNAVRSLTGVTVKGGGDVRQNGLLPMSHTGSAFGSAFDLSGAGTYTKVRGGSIARTEAPSALMVVRRKEAAIVSQWLQILLDDGEWDWDRETKQTLEVAATLNTDDVSVTSTQFTEAYDQVISTATGGHTFDDDQSGDLEQQIVNHLRGVIGRYIQMRTEYFFYSFEE